MLGHSEKKQFLDTKDQLLSADLMSGSFEVSPFQTKLWALTRLLQKAATSVPYSIAKLLPSFRCCPKCPKFMRSVTFSKIMQCAGLESLLD